MPSHGSKRRGGIIVTDNAAPYGSCSTLLEVDAFAQFLAGLEVRDMLLGHLHAFAGLGIASRPRRPIVQAEAAEAADLDPLALGQAVGHGVEDHLHRELGVLGYQLRELRRQAVDQLRLGHHGLAYPWFLLSSLALRRAPRLVVPALAPAFSALMRWIASASSALSLALIDRLIERFLRSMLMIIAETASPSFRCERMSSTRSRET